MKHLLIVTSLLTFANCRNEVAPQEGPQSLPNSVIEQGSSDSKPDKVIEEVVEVATSTEYVSCEAELVEHKNFSLCYAEEHEQASWVSYVLTKSETEGSQKRNRRVYGFG